MILSTSQRDVVATGTEKAMILSASQRDVVATKTERTMMLSASQRDVVAAKIERAMIELESSNAVNEKGEVLMYLPSLPPYWLFATGPRLRHAYALLSC